MASAGTRATWREQGRVSLDADATLERAMASLRRVARA
jgi:hypothetical protein